MFSKLDLQSGFHQLRIREGDQDKTAFTTPGAAGAQYEWVTCPFGLTNTPSCFQRLMNHVLFDHIAANYCVVYCDDVLIYTETESCSGLRWSFLDFNCQRQDGLQQNPRLQLLWNGPRHRQSNTCVPFWGWRISLERSCPSIQRRLHRLLIC